MKRVFLLVAMLWSGQVSAQTAFLEQREFRVKNGMVRVKMAVSHTRNSAVVLTVRLKGPGKDQETPGPVLSDGVTIAPDHFKIPPNKIRKLMLSFPAQLSTRTPYFACVLYQPPVERMEVGRLGGSMLLATESCSRFWVNP